jgi:G-patch domain
MGLAAKMMEKMGWRGGGLGREQQVHIALPCYSVGRCIT